VSVVHDVNEITFDGLSDQQSKQLKTILVGCRDVLEELQDKLDKSHVLSYSTREWKLMARIAWARITWDQAEIDRFREKVTSSMSLFNSLMRVINQYGSCHPAQGYSF
jgi:hypothetical protein